MKKIAFLDDHQAVALKSADWSVVMAGAEIVVFRDHLENDAALVERLRPFDAIWVMRERTPLNAGILESLPNLKFIGSDARYNASIDLDAARRQGAVASGTGGRGNGAPERTWAMILSAAKHIPAEQGSIRSGGWQVGVGADLQGRRLGLLGLGKVGTRVAAVGRAFGMNVMAWRQNLTAGAAAMRVDVPSRRAIAGAALEVFDTEPLPDAQPLRMRDNVLSPHVGFVTQRTYRVFYEETVQNLVAWMNGSPLRVISK